MTDGGPPFPAVTPELVARLIGSARVDLSREACTQADLNTFLAARLPLGCTLQREFRLSPEDRPDFLIDGRIAVEVKLNANTRGIDVWRQLARYARHDCVEAIVYAGNKRLGPMAAGLILKPVVQVSLGSAWL